MGNIFDSIEQLNGNSAWNQMNENSKILNSESSVKINIKEA